MSDTPSTLDRLPAGSAFLCVCGERLPFTRAEDIRCPACQRSYSAEALARAPSETLTEILLPAAPGRPPPNPLQLGERLGHFKLVDVIGQGGMGVVYKAMDESLQRHVALKVIRVQADEERNSRYIDRLFHEARAQARVNHPNVAHIYFVGREGSVAYFAMELVNGPTIASQLVAGPLPFDYVIDAAVQVARALDHAARLDLVHGDIKPSNMLYTRERLVKLSDFGQAGRISQAGAPTDNIAGTPYYMPPEAVDGRSTGLAGDMYMLGVSWFQMTFGRLPFRFPQKTFRAMMEVHREAPIDFPSPWPANVPRRWRDILARMMAKKSEDRYPDYPTLLRDLDAVRPLALPQAGRAARAMAWFFDISMAIFFYLAALAAADLAVTRYAAQFPWLTRIPLADAVRVSVPIVGSLLQALWGVSLGKMLLQLRIVDRHGFPIGRFRLFCRTLFQLLPLWYVAVPGAMSILGIHSGIGWLGAAIYGVLGLDAMVQLFDQKGRSLHDHLFGTRVVYAFAEPAREGAAP